MIGAGAQPQGTQLIQPNSGSYGSVNVPYQWPASNQFKFNYTPKTDKERQDLFTWMDTDRNKQYKLAEQGMKWNGGLQAAKLGCETLTKSLDSIFTHVANMKQLTNYETYLNNQHDIAKRSIGLESKKLDVQKEMQNDQLRYQLKVAQYGKEKDVTIAAIHEKGKTKRVQALAALRDIYGRGNPVTPFQRYMT
jgi:hypothetical protein